MGRPRRSLAQALGMAPRPLLYRGTQHPDEGVGVRGAASYTPSLPVAAIWSARPGDWGKPASFVQGSTVHAIEFVGADLVLEKTGTSTTFGAVLRALGYEDGGITQDEARRILNYLHNRLTGKAPGGAFHYRVEDEDGDNLDERDVVDLSLVNPQSLVSFFRDEWDWEPTVQTADRLTADTFIFADAPAVQRAARNQGCTALGYLDVFSGGERAARDLLGQDVGALKGVSFSLDLNGERVPTHWTIRPLVPVIPAWSRPVQNALDDATLVTP